MDNTPPTTHRISEFYRWQTEGSLKLNPPFQRNPVWSDKNRSYLIDTVLNQLPVPEIYMQVDTNENGYTKYIVVDGQQRIRAILDFIAGTFAILESESTAFGGKEFKELADEVRKDFWDYSIVTREIKTSNEEEVRNIFKRLNKYVVPLNNQELRNATFKGKFINLMNKLAEDDFLSDNKIVSPNDIRRMKDVEYISELFVAIIEGVQGGTRDVLDKFYKYYDVDFPNEKEFENEFVRTKNFLNDLFGNLRGTGWNSRADYYSLFVCSNQAIKNYYLPDDNQDRLKNKLLEFRKQVNIQKENSKEKDMLQYYKSMQGGVAQKENRNIRLDIVKRLMLPFFVPKDNKRAFTEEQRQLAWDMSNDKKCAICGKVINYSDYELDHKMPYSKGGKTTIENSQITHKKCNKSKSNK